MKVLIAEDSPFYRRMLESALAEWGYEVVAASDGTRAWEILCGADRPRLAIVDWMMPGIDGLELCRRVRARGAAEPTYLILLTARGGKEDVVTGLTAGADDYIAKPFDVDELRTRIGTGRRIVELQGSLAARVRELEHALSGAQKMEAVGRLAGGVAHDFNNLLTVIISGSDLLGHLVREPAQRELLDMIKQAGERGASLTRQLLAFSRRQVMQPEVLQLNVLLADLQKMLRRLIAENIELVADFAPDLGCVRADPGQLGQVVMNLVVNARDAMPDGGTITLRTRNVDVSEHPPARQGAVPPGAYAVLAIADTGCGMGEDVQAHLFEPFFTTKELHKGTGLGLATVYGIVQQTGGHVRVESAPGRGSTFLIYLPRTDEPLVVVAPAAGAARAGTRETILLVEDEDGVRAMARRALCRKSYTVLEARDGEEALRVSAQWADRIHLLLTDIVMPRTSGRQLADLLQPQRPDMKVLYMSGYTDDAALCQEVAGSGKPFLQKPFTPSVLASKVREVLDE